MTYHRLALLPPAAAALIALCAGPGEVRAHPHVWITAITTFEFEDRQLTAIRHRWRFDEMFSSFVIGEHDAEGDGVLDAAEIANVWENAFANLEEHGYFTHLRVGEELLRLDRVRDSAATIEGEVLI